MDLDASSSTGGVARIGVDIDMEGGWAVNLAASKVNMNTKVKVLAEGIQVPGLRRIKVEVDPVVWSVGAVRRF